MERYKKYLTQTENVYVNPERVESIDSISGNETLAYVNRTLEILNQQADTLTDEEDNIIRTVLCWSEVSKGGSKKERATWINKGYPLSIHNIASAEIYKDDAGEDYSDIVYTLIKTHGIIGQCIRGEISMEKNRPLLLLSKSNNIDLKKVLIVLNRCIIEAVDTDIWKNVEKTVESIVEDIVSEKLSELSPEYRLQQLCPRELELFENDVQYFAKEIFPKYELWYFSSALSDFDMSQIRTILGNVESVIAASKEAVEHINFKPLADNLYYDYEGKKHINVYKKRIIEKYLLDSSVQNVDIQVKIENKSAYVDFKFSKVCEKLIDFCVEAERCGLLTFEKSIIVLYDMFGFRRDAFDRLNNEDKYLSTMNDVSSSSKDGIIDYVVGESVVDVGSGGGILLNRLEKKYPDKQVIGTDISTNVIETLIQKKNREGHNWNVRVHNFVDSRLDKPVGSIVFSSILHEIYSYTEGANGRFDIESVKNALKNAFESIQCGGRIIIRDGVKTEGSYVRGIRFKDEKGLDFFKNYVRDFRGLKELTEEQKVSVIDEDKLTVFGDVNFIREFLFTYTWGTESYAHEVQEQFGYFTLKEYQDFFKEIGAKIVEAQELLEAGYPDNLNKYLTLIDEEGNEVDYPASNIIIVAEKIK